MVIQIKKGGLIVKLIIFTADENNGGIKQFTLQILQTCLKIGYESTLFIPKIDSIIIPDSLKKYVVRYKKQKDILGIMPEMIRIARMINSLNPDCVFLPDDSMFSIQVLRYVNRNIPIYMTIHDVTMHPSKLSFKRKVLNFISLKIYRKIAFKRVKKIVVLSNNSKNRLSFIYPKIANKITVMLLGAHCPLVDELYNPKEVIDTTINYFLFFGRIQKYKGLIRALKSFNSIDNHNNYKFIIAGNGKLTLEEKNEIDKSKDIILINRYIEDEEMLWLIANSKIVVLPYIEASQSGVVPLCYHFGKPILASKIDGIIEFTNEKTSLLFNNDEELKEYMKRIIFNEIDFDLYSKNCLDFEKEFLDWEKNIKNLIEE